MTDASQEIRERSRKTWSTAATVWERDRDRMWEATSHVSEWLIEKLDPRYGQVILDLAAGLGDTGYLAAPLVGDTGKVVTTDMTPEMLEAAQRRAAQLGLNNVEFRAVDAEKMDLPDDSFDGALCRWGFMLMADPGAAFSETRRVLREGARLSFTVWGPMERNPRPIRNVLVEGGHIEDVDQRGPGGINSLGDRRLLESLLIAAGLSILEFEEIPVSWRYAELDEYWKRSVEGGIFEDAIANLDGAEIARLLRNLEQAMEDYRDADGYLLPALTLGVLAG